MTGDDGARDHAGDHRRWQRKLRLNQALKVIIPRMPSGCGAPTWHLGHMFALTDAHFLSAFPIQNI